MNETYKEINEAGFCVIEVENWHGSGMVAYLVNLKEKCIAKKIIYPGCEAFDIINEITSNDIAKIIDTYTDYSIADIDDDYLFHTDYLLIRLQSDIED